MDEIQHLKKDLSLKRKALRQAEKIFNELESKNKGIVEPFAKAKENLDILDKDSKEFNNEKTKLETRKAELKVEETKLKDLEWRHEVLFQKFELLEREYNGAQEKLADSLLEQRQKFTMNDMILKKKTTELYVIAQDHVSVLFKMLAKGSAKENDTNNILLKGSEKDITIEDLEGMQSEMQRLHNAFVARKSNIIGELK